MTLSAKRAQAYQNAKNAYESFLLGTFEHEKMSPIVWCAEISTLQEFIAHQSSTRACRILMYESIAGTLLVFAEHTEPVTSYSIQKLTSDYNIFIGMNDPKEVTITMEDWLRPKRMHAAWPRLLISDKLFPGPDSSIMLQYNASRTLKLNKKAFDVIIKHFPNQEGPLDIVSSTKNISSWTERDMEGWKEEVMKRIHILEDTNICISESNALQRRTSHARHEYVTNTLKKESDNMNEMRQRFGPLHESIVRLSLAVTRGLDWGKSKQIFGLYDMFSFVAAGFKATGIDRHIACKSLYKYLVRGFKSWEYNPKHLRLSEISPENVYRDCNFF